MTTSREDEDVVLGLLARHSAEPAQQVRDTPRGGLWRAGDACVRVDHRPEVPLQGMLELAEALVQLGLPVVRALSPTVTTLPSGRRATVWGWVEQDAPLDFRGLGVTLRAVHATAPVGRALGDWDSVQGFNAQVLVTYVDPALTVPDRLDALREALATAFADCSAVAREAGVLCHGDVTPANVVQSAAGPVLLDLETTMAAPAEWDLAVLHNRVMRYGDLPPDAFDALLAGYGDDDLDLDLVLAFSRLRGLVEVAGVGAYASVERRHTTEFVTRLGWALDGDSTPWHWPAEEGHGQ